MIATLQRATGAVREIIEAFGENALFLVALLRDTPGSLARPGLVVVQVYAVGARTLVLISVAGFFVGAVLGLQLYYTLAKFGASQTLGSVTVLAMVRELGPVVTAVLFAGRAGTALASEIGLMRATEQLAGMEMMAVDPFRRVIVPRFLAGVISMPLLAAIFSALGILGAYLVGVELKGLDSAAFWVPIQSTVDTFDDVGSGMVKSLVFGIAASMIAVHEGYRAHPTAEGVSTATTRTVIVTALTVLVLDFMLTALFIQG